MPWRRSRRRSITSLASRGSNVHVSVLAPEMVATGLRQSRRNMPSDLDEGITEKTETEHAIEARTAQMPKMTPAEVADQVFDAIREERFYILPGWGGVVSGAEQRFNDIKAGSTEAAHIPRRPVAVRATPPRPPPP